MAELLLAIGDLRAGYGSAVVLDDISLNLAAQGSLAVLGRNLGNQLSGGEQQMLAISRALMTNPALLLLDEPFEGLAPIVVEELIAAIRRMIAERSNAFVLVEQHAEIALPLTENVIVLERGRIVHRGPSTQLLA